MNSKEALKYLSNECIRKYDIYSNNCWNNEIAAYDKVRDCLNTIKKDLERLEKLEKAIELLKDKLKFELAIYRNGGCTLKHYMNKQTMVSDDTCLRHLEIEEYELLKEVLCDV